MKGKQTETMSCKERFDGMNEQLEYLNSLLKVMKMSYSVCLWTLGSVTCLQFCMQPALLFCRPHSKQSTQLSCLGIFIQHLTLKVFLIPYSTLIHYLIPHPINVGHWHPAQDQCWSAGDSVNQTRTVFCKCHVIFQLITTVSFVLSSCSKFAFFRRACAVLLDLVLYSTLYMFFKAAFS